MTMRMNRTSAMMAPLSGHRAGIDTRPHALLVCYLLSLVVLLSSAFVSGVEAQAAGGQKPVVYTVVEVSGEVLVQPTVDEPLRQIDKNSSLSGVFLLQIKEGGSIGVKAPAGSLILLKGPAKGMLGNLVAEVTSKTSNVIRQTLDKVPGPKFGEKRVNISTPSTGLTKAAKAQKRPMPYIWKVKQTEKKTGDK